jgi:predicted RNA-binding Zn-ribbon protein involved in translation (DUF1610 family)
VVGHSVCACCGSKLTHLRGATGHVSICPRCGWSRVELTRDERAVTSGVALGHGAVAQQDEAMGTQWSG